MSQRSAGSCTRCTRSNAFPEPHNLLHLDAEVSRWGGGIADNHLPLTSVCLCFLNAAHKSSKDENQSSAVCLILTKIKATFFVRILFPVSIEKINLVPIHEIGAYSFHHEQETVEG